MEAKRHRSPSFGSRDNGLDASSGATGSATSRLVRGGDGRVPRRGPGRGRRSTRRSVATSEIDGSAWSSDEAFRAFAEEVRAQRLEETPRPASTSPPPSSGGSTATSSWAGRHPAPADAALLEVGGHIGYDVRPSARRRGHATAMLREALPSRAGSGSSVRSSPATSTTSRPDGHRAQRRGPRGRARRKAPVLGADALTSRPGRDESQ